MKSRNWRATWMSSKLSMRALYMFKFRLIAYVTSNPKQEPICQINVARIRMHPSGISLALVQGMSHEWLEFLPNIDPKEEGNPHVATWLPWIPISLQVFPKNIYIYIYQMLSQRYLWHRFAFSKFREPYMVHTQQFPGLSFWELHDS